MDESPTRLLRVVKGTPSAEELAALAVVLLARAAHPGQSAGRRYPARARWHRPERMTGFIGARTWQTAELAHR
jgi:Acyl-CoA carboxylase epsilon subunit